MRKIMVLVLGLLFCLTALEFGLRATRYISITLQQRGIARKIKSKGMFRIVCFGDSMTQHMYPDFLQKALDEKSGKDKFVVFDEGLSITGTDYIISILDDSIAKYDPWMIIVMSGDKDSNTLVFQGDAVRRKTPLIDRVKVYRLLVLLGREIEYKLIETKLLAIPAHDQGLKSRAYQHYYDLGTRYVGEKRYAQAEVALKRALEIAPEESAAYWRLHDLYSRTQEYTKSEQWMADLIKKNPANAQFYHIMAHIYLAAGSKEEALRYFKRTVEMDKNNSDAWCYLLAVARQAGKNYDFEALLRNIPVNYNDRFYGAKAIKFLEERNLVLADENFTKAEMIRASMRNPRTAANYRIIADKALSKGIKIAYMQYPMRSIEPLKDILQSYDNIIFIDNKKLFEDALFHGHYDDYFRDQFAGDFGHCNAKGNALMADHMADIILREATAPPQ